MAYRKVSVRAFVDSLSPEERDELRSIVAADNGRRVAQRMTPEQRTERARKAAAARWGTK